MGTLDRLRKSNGRLAPQSRIGIKVDAPAKAEPAEWRKPDGTFAPGNHAAPTIRGPLELAGLVRAGTGEGQVLFDWLLDIAAGLEPHPVRDIDKESGEVILRAASGKPNAADRLRAITTLKIWGWGKEKETIEIDAKVAPQAGAFDLERLSPAELRSFLEITRKARGALVEGQVKEVQPEDAVVSVSGLQPLSLERMDLPGDGGIRAEGSASVERLPEVREPSSEG